MQDLTEGSYRTPARPISWFARTFPSLTFHCRFVRRVIRAGRLAKSGRYDARQWAEDSLQILRDLEDTGVRFEIAGVHHFASMDQPCVFVGNHMSTLETMVLPGIIQPYHPVTFVVKSTLMHYPFFSHILRTRDPIVVGRKNPREDLKTVLEGGVERLQRGISIVVFPQHTRMRQFDPQRFNKIGVKLAARAGVPLVPLALQTDAWGYGWFHNDFGRIRPSRPVKFAFGQPVSVRGNGRDEHQAVCEFILEHINQWEAASHSN